MKAVEILVFILMLILYGCNGQNDSQSSLEKEKQESIRTFQNTDDYYKSIFTPLSVKDLEKRVFTGLTIMEKLGKGYEYKLPNGNNIKVDYFPQNNPLLFRVETINGDGKFELYKDYELLKISCMDYFLIVCLTNNGIFQIVEIENGNLFSVSYFLGKYKGTCEGRDFEENDKMMQGKIEKFCRQFMEKKYKTLKDGLKIDDIYRIYCKAAKK